MPILNIEGRRVTVDDAFLQLPAEQQNATVDEIASSLSSAPSASLKAAQQDQAMMPDAWDQFPDAAPPQQDAWAQFPDAPSPRLKAAQRELSNLSQIRPEVSQGRAALEGALSGASGGLRDEAFAASEASGLPGILGGFRAPIGAARLGYEAATSPGSATEAYNRALERIRAVQKTGRENYPATTLAAEVGGALALPFGAGANSVRGAAGTGAALGALYGFGGGEGTEERLAGAGLGAVGGAVLGAAGQKVLGAVAPTALRPGQEAVEAARRVGTTLPRGYSSDAKLVQMATQGVRQSPIAGGTIENAIERTTSGLDEAVNAIETSLGRTTPVSAGTAAKDALVEWIGPRSAQYLDKLYTAVDSAVSPNAITPLTRTAAALRTINARRSAAKAEPSALANDLADAVKSGLDYDSIKWWRTTIGQQLSGKVAPQWPEAELKQVYGALTDDLRQSIARSAGNAGVRLWERANSEASRIAKSRKALATIIGERGDVPAEKVIDKLAGFASTASRGDVVALGRARQVMNQAEWNQVASALIAKLGRNVEGSFTPDRFVTAWGKLSPQAENLLFTPQHRAALNDIAMVSSRMKQVGAFANRSNTARGIFTLGGLGGLGVAGSALTPGSSLNSPEGLARAAVGGAAVPLTVALLLSRPAGASAAARYLNAVYRAAKTGSAKTATTAQRVFAVDIAKAFNDPGGADN